MKPARVPRVPGHAAERDREQDLLPRLDRRQRAAAHAGRVERGEDGVVQRQTDDEGVERNARPTPDERRGGRHQDEVDGERNRIGHGAERTGEGRQRPPPAR